MTVYSIDFETALIEPGLQIPPPVCLSWATKTQAEVVFWTDAYEIVKDLLKNHYVVGANTGYDIAVACETWPDLWPLAFRAYDEDRVTDVLVRQKLIDIAMGEHRAHGLYNLATVTKRLTGRELVKEDTWRLRYWELIDVPLTEWPKDAIDYSREDSSSTIESYYVQEHELAAIDRLCVLDDQYRQTRADLGLHLASAWGLRTDAKGVAALRQQCETRLAALEIELTDAGLLVPTYKGRGKEKHQVGLKRSTRAAQERIAASVEKPKLTKKGYLLKREGDPSWKEIKYISTDEEACSDSTDPVMSSYSDYVTTNSLLSGHVVAMEKGITTPIHTHFEVLLDTGRTSSSNPNVQNVRRAPGARECFVPRKGWCFIGCDYDKAELHTLAQCCVDLFGRSSLADALNNGFDPHTGLGARLAHTTYEDLLGRVAAGDEAAAEWRQRAKPANFGFPGGMGPNGMVAYAKSNYGILITRDEAEALYASWQEQWPEVAFDYLGWIRELTSEAGHATIEHFVSKRWRGRCTYCVAANSFFQGRSADGMKAALWEVTKKCYLPGTSLFGCRVVNEVHDEIIVEAPIEQAPEAAEEMRTTMIGAYNVFTPDVPVRASPVLMDRWSKKAKEIRDESGRLQLWRYNA